MDDIENELTRFDNLGEGREGESAVQQGGMGSRVVGCAFFLKSLFTQTEPCKQSPSVTKFTRLSRTLSVSKELREPILSKHKRQNFVEEMEEESGSRN